jgi:hypothetical protein
MKIHTLLLALPLALCAPLSVLAEAVVHPLVTSDYPAPGPATDIPPLGESARTPQDGAPAAAAEPTESLLLCACLTLDLLPETGLRAG